MEKNKAVETTNPHNGMAKPKIEAFIEDIIPEEI